MKVHVINKTNYKLFTVTEIQDDYIYFSIFDDDTREKIPREAIRFIRKTFRGPLIGAEIGTDNGNHARQILNLLDCKLYLIDIWEDYYETNYLNEKPRLVKHRSTEKLIKDKFRKDNVEVIKGKSVKIAKQFVDNFFDFVYIDANHTYENVKADILAWRPKVKPGGVICGHDYCDECEGVKKAVDELLPNAISTDKIRYPDWYWRKDDLR